MRSVTPFLSARWARIAVSSVVRLCAQSLAANATGRLNHVWLCHLSEENNHPELARKTVEMGLAGSGNPDLAQLKVDVLKRNSPSGAYILK